MLVLLELETLMTSTSSSIYFSLISNLLALDLSL